MKTLEDWLLHLEGLHPKGQAGIELGLERIRLVKAALGQTSIEVIDAEPGTKKTF